MSNEPWNVHLSLNVASLSDPATVMGVDAAGHRQSRPVESSCRANMTSIHDGLWKSMVFAAPLPGNWDQNVRGQNFQMGAVHSIEIPVHWMSLDNENTAGQSGLKKKHIYAISCPVDYQCHYYMPIKPADFCRILKLQHNQTRLPLFKN